MPLLGARGGGVPGRSEPGGALGIAPSAERRPHVPSGRVVPAVPGASLVPVGLEGVVGVSVEAQLAGVELVDGLFAHVDVCTPLRTRSTHHHSDSEENDEKEGDAGDDYDGN